MRVNRGTAPPRRGPMRTHRQPRAVLEQAMAEPDGGAPAAAFASGGAALPPLGALLHPGDGALFGERPYADAHRLAQEVEAREGIGMRCVPTHDVAAVEAPLVARTRALGCEAPSTSPFKVSDGEAPAAVSRRPEHLFIVDTTPRAPLPHRPFALGADVTTARLRSGASTTTTWSPV
jgi:cystathionine beta-lyase/cystathionine gamma-synthase